MQFYFLFLPSSPHPLHLSLSSGHLAYQLVHDKVALLEVDIDGVTASVSANDANTAGITARVVDDILRLLKAGEDILYCTEVAGVTKYWFRVARALPTVQWWRWSRCTGQRWLEHQLLLLDDEDTVRALAA